MRIALALAALVALSGCGLRPLYGGGSDGRVAAALASVSVAPISGRDGWLVQNALRDRIAIADGSAARFRLEVELDDQIEGFGIRADDAVTRERRSLRARYRLVDLEAGQTVLDATAGSDAGIDVVRSEFATIAAENTALERLAAEVADQIVARIATYAARAPAGP